MFALRGAKLTALEQHLLGWGVVNMTEDKGTVSTVFYSFPRTFISITTQKSN